MVRGGPALSATMDLIELRAMLNSENKEERIRARRLVRPRVPRARACSVSRRFPVRPARVLQTTIRPTSRRLRVVRFGACLLTPHDASSSLGVSTIRSQRVAARVAARERERDEAAAAFAERERAASAATPGEPGRARDGSRGGSRPASARVPSIGPSRPGSAGTPRLPDAVAAKHAASDAVGAETDEKNSARSAAAAARRETLRADREASFDASGVRALADAREYRRRRNDRDRRVRVRAMVRAEAEQSRSTEAEIEKGWETIGTYAKNEPTALRDALASLRMRCEASARSKDEAAAFVAAELDRREDAYAESLRKQNGDIDELLRRMRARAKEQRARARRALETLESDLEARRRALLERDDAEMRGFFEKRESAERAFAERTASNERKYEDELEQRRADDDEQMCMLKTRLETDVANLEQHLARARAVYQLNAEKLEYNHRVLVEREAENQSTSSQQRKKIASAREKLMVLRREHAEAEKAFSAENVKLTEEHRRAAETFKELQMKHKRFVRADTRKFEEVWAMQEALVAAKVRRVLDADRVIHEQQLGWRWRPPSDDVFLKPDDLASVERRKKREAAAAAAEAVADETDAAKHASVSVAPARPEAEGDPSIAASEDEPEPRPSRAELEAAFWKRQASVVGEKPSRAWAALERGLEKYLVTLTKRRDALEQTASLAKENKELRGLVRQCLGADVNDALLVQPSALL